MSPTEMLLSTLEWLKRHKMLLGILVVATAAPSLVFAAPDLMVQFEELPQRIRITAIAVVGVLALALAIASIRGVFRALRGAWNRRVEAAEERRASALHDKAFKSGTLPGAESVSIVWRAAGSVTNIVRRPSRLPGPLNGSQGEIYMCKAERVGLGVAH